MGQKSYQGIRLLDENGIEGVILGKEFAILLPEIPVKLGTQRNWISKPTFVRERERCDCLEDKTLFNDLKILDARE